jgi:hypothetical protein
MNIGRWMVFGGIVCALAMLSGTAAYAVSPCSLLTPAEAAAALGVAEVSTGSPTATKLCEWTPKKYAPGPSKDLTVTLESAAGFAAAHQPLGREVTAVSGIGDEAVQTTTQGTRTVLTVKKGDVYFAVRVSGLPVDQAKAAEQALAMKIISKL